MSAKTVFISYNHGDSEVADKLKSALEKNGIVVRIDKAVMDAGANIQEFIENSVRDTDVTLSIVSNRSLQSAWVAMESITAFYSEKLQSNKKFIGCYIDDDFFKPGYRLEANKKINAEIAEIDKLIPEYITETLDTIDLNSRRTRLIRLRNNLGDILLKLTESLTLDIREPHFGDSVATIVRTIKKFQGDVIEPPSSSQRRELELAYLEGLRADLSDAERYTPVSGASHQKRIEMRTLFEHKPFQLMSISKSPRMEQESRRFENAVEEISEIRRAVLLGEPGSGKTMTLYKLAADLCEKAIQDSKAPIPLLIPLGKWTEADQPLAAFVASRLPSLGEFIDQLLVEKRAALLLDGLNELPAGDRDKKYPQVQRLIEMHPMLMALVSCRELDYTVDLGFDRINIMPLDPLRIREFVKGYLDEDKGEEFFWKLAGQKAKSRLAQFLQGVANKLPEAEKIFWVERELPKGVHWGYSWPENDNSLWQSWLKERETPSSLMVLASTPYMLMMLTSVYAEQGELPENRGQLFQLFIETLLEREKIPEGEQTSLIDGLARVAFKMQIRRSGDDGNALTVLPQSEVKDILGDRLFYLAASASILNTGDQVRFTHQLLQEYFAAKFMDLEIGAGRLKASEIWPPDRWWERTNWEEAAKLLAGLYNDDCSRIVEWVAEANPEVAAQCAVQSGAACSEPLLELLRPQWIPRLTDLKNDPDPKARASVGRALGLTGLDNRKGVGTFVDGLVQLG